MPDDRLPAREQDANLPQPDRMMCCGHDWVDEIVAPPARHLAHSIVSSLLGPEGIVAERVTALVAENARLREAAAAANQAMRLYNRGGMTWLELDRTFARLEALLDG